MRMVRSPGLLGCIGTRWMARDRSLDLPVNGRNKEALCP